MGLEYVEIIRCCSYQLGHSSWLAALVEIIYIIVALGPQIFVWGTQQTIFYVGPNIVWYKQTIEFSSTSGPT